MSVVLAAAFPDFAVIMSDSRITIRKKDGSSHQDKQRKIFQVAPYLAVGFVSNDVRLSRKIIKGLTEYANKKVKSLNSVYLMERLPRVAKYIYEKETVHLRVKQEMEFVYAGAATGFAGSHDSKRFFELIQKLDSSFSLSPEIQSALFGIKKNGQMTFPAPAKIIKTQSLPSGEIRETHSLAIVTTGSGMGVMDKLKPDIEKVMLSPYKEMRIFILETALREYIASSGIDTIGGLIQIAVIDKDGVAPFSYSFSTFDPNGNEQPINSMVFKDGKWTQTNHITGNEIEVTTNPLIFNNDDTFSSQDAAEIIS